MQVSPEGNLTCFQASIQACQTQVRFYALFELIHMLHRLCEPPSIPLSFSLATVLPRRPTSTFASAVLVSEPPQPSRHRLQRGLPGYLIPFAPHAFVSQRQNKPSAPISPLAFLLISTHSTAPPRVPCTPTCLKKSSSSRNSPVKPGDFTRRLLFRLHTL